MLRAHLLSSFSDEALQLSAVAVPTQNQDDTAQCIDKLEQMMEKLLEEQNAPATSAAVSQMSFRNNGRPYKKPQPVL